MTEAQWTNWLYDWLSGKRPDMPPLLHGIPEVPPVKMGTPDRKARLAEAKAVIESFAPKDEDSHPHWDGGKYETDDYDD